MLNTISLSLTGSFIDEILSGSTGFYRPTESPAAPRQNINLNSTDHKFHLLHPNITEATEATGYQPPIDDALAERLFFGLSARRLVTELLPISCIEQNKRMSSGHILGLILSILGRFSLNIGAKRKDPG